MRDGFRQDGFRQDGFRTQRRSGSAHHLTLVHASGAEASVRGAVGPFVVDYPTDHDGHRLKTTNPVPVENEVPLVRASMVDLGIPGHPPECWTPRSMSVWASSRVGMAGR